MSKKLVDIYVIKDGLTVQLYEEEGEYLVPISSGRYLVYNESYDGEMIPRSEAIEKYPEYFI